MIIQLLFNILEFRNGIINIDINYEIKNAIVSLKKLFIDMIMYNEGKKYIIPKFFINNYDNQIIDTYIQKDAGEFLLNLLDKIGKTFIIH